MNVNHSIISGNLTRDPETRTAGADRSVTAFTIAHNSRYKTADGEQREETSFIDCEAWGRQGELAAQYLVKGSLTIVEGRIKQDNWTDKDSQKRSKLKLVVERVHLTPRLARTDEGNESPDSSGPAADHEPAARAPASVRPAPKNPTTGTSRPAGRAPSAATAIMEQPPF